MMNMMETGQSRQVKSATVLGWMLVVALVLLSVAGAPRTALAVLPSEVLQDPVLEKRARSLSAVLRCLVCQNQSIDESDADLARDLRVIVRERLVGGDSDTEILDYLVARYGEFVLLKPRLGAHTLVLWSVGPVLLLMGLISIVLIRRSRVRFADTVQGLSEAEEKAIEKLLKD